MMVIVTAIRAVDMALGGPLFSQEGGAALTDIGIGLGGKLIHAGQDAKSHSL